MLIRVVSFAALTVLGLTLASSSACAQPSRVWLAPLHPNATHGPEGAADYFEMFARRDLWPRVAGRVAVFKIYTDVLDRATDDQLRALFAGVTDAGIALAVETPVLAHAFGCGPAGTEGAPWVIAYFTRLKALGANPRYLAMDGPWVVGSANASVKACPHGMNEIADDLAGTVRAVRTIFPAIEVGDIEPVTVSALSPDWAALPAWLTALRRALGAPPAFLHLDVTWEADWRPALPKIARDAAAAGVRLGVILNGGGRAMSDQEDAGDVADHAAAVEAKLGGPPADAVFQT